MIRHAKTLLSAGLLFSGVVLFHGCGGAGANKGGQAQTPAAPASGNPVAPVSGNRAPTIDRVGDEYARVGESYSFQPSAGDLDGDTLRFSATNLPTWASIDPATGRITGTPGIGDLGVYESVVISVADATRRAETAAFTITVVGEVVATGTATLRWEAPPSKQDGSPLDDLAGYRILFGRSADDLDQSILINDPTITSYEFTALPKGVWFFTVVAVNSGGLEGPPTVVMTKSI